VPRVGVAADGKLITVKGAVIVVFGIRIVIEQATIEILDIRKEVK